jgi:hypothetical protein
LGKGKGKAREQNLVFQTQFWKNKGTIFVFSADSCSPPNFDKGYFSLAKTILETSF